MSEFELPLKLTEDEKNIDGIKTLYPIIEESFKLKDLLMGLEIDSIDSLAIANGKAIDAKKLMKKITAKRKEMAEPYDKARKTLLDIEKRILSPLVDGVEDITARIIAFQEIVEQREKAELAKLETSKEDLGAQKEELKALELKIYRSINEKTTVDELQTVAKKAVFAKDGTSALQKLVVRCNSEDIAEMAALTKERCKRYGKAKKEVLEGGEDNLDMLLDVLQQEMDDSLLLTTNKEAVAIEAKISSTSNKKAVTSIRKSIKYQVMDMDAVPDKYKVIDVSDNKIKEFLKETDKEIIMKTIEDHPNKIIDGLRFYIEKIHVGR